MLVHLEHADLILAAEDLLQLVVSKDFPLVLRILQVVLANVIPHFRNDLTARKRVASGDRGEIRRRSNRASKSAPCFTNALCHSGPPVVPPVDRAQSSLHCNAVCREGVSDFPS